MSENKHEPGTCYLLGHSHLDAAWLWTFKESIEVFHDTCESILKLMEKYPDFCFCQSSAQYYRWMEDKYPETLEKIRKRIEEGRWEIVGGTWIEPDGNLPSGESYARQYLYGKKYFMEKFGIDVKIGWMPDSFGYAWSLPQIMKKSGIDFFLTQKMHWNDTTDFPYYFFRWTSPDGSSVLAHQGVGSYSENVDTSEIYRQMTRLESRHHLNELLVLFGTGDHGGGVTESMIKRASDFVHGKKKVKGVFSTAKRYFEAVTSKISPENFPEITDELYLQFHRGTYTNQGKVKKNNRKAESLLETAEKLSVLATGYGYVYPRDRLEGAWEILMLNQFHDVLPGSSLPEVYADSEEQFRFVLDTAGSVISKSLGKIASRIDTSADGRSIVVFNSLSWPRSDLVEVQMKDLGTVFEIYDDQQKIVPSQILEKEGKVIFFAENVPSVGYKEYKARRTGHTTQELSTDLTCAESDKEIKLENRFLALRVDKVTGLVTSLFDKENNMEVIEGEGNVIQVFDDTPIKGRTSVNFPIDALMFDPWEIYIYQQSGGSKFFELREPIEVQLAENGPVRATVRVRYKYIQKDRPDSFFDEEIVLCHATPLVRFNLHIDWHASHRLAKVAFPLKVHSDCTTYEIPYGYITRKDYTSPHATKEDKAKYEVPSQKWIDHTRADGGYGVSLLNDSKYGFDVGNDVIRMTLLRSARYAAEMRMTMGLTYDKATAAMIGDQGEHNMSYALLPHKSDFRNALTARKGYEFNYPLMQLVEVNHDGPLPPVHSFLSIEPDNLILTAVKMSEGSDDVVLRFYETFGKETDAVIRFAQSFDEPREVDLIEREISKVKTKKGTIELPVGKYEIKTVRITMRTTQRVTN